MPPPRAKAGSRHILVPARLVRGSAGIIIASVPIQSLLRPKPLLPVPHKRYSCTLRKTNPPRKMLIDRHALLHLQDAFDRATAAYKLQVGDRTAWSDFYDSVLHGLNSVKPSPPMAPHAYAEAVGVRALELRLEVLAEYPELLVRSSTRLGPCCDTDNLIYSQALTRQELNTARGYPLVQVLSTASFLPSLLSPGSRSVA